jgi:hypothetical protein
MPFTCRKCPVCPHTTQALCPRCDPDAQASAPEKRSKARVFNVGPLPQYGSTFSLTWTYPAERRTVEEAC